MDEEKKKKINEAIHLMEELCEEYRNIDGVCYDDCPMYRNCHCGEPVVAWWEID